MMVADKDQQRSKSVDTAWTVDENMVGILPRSGELLNVLVITAQALVVGTALTRPGWTADRTKLTFSFDEVQRDPEEFRRC